MVDSISKTVITIFSGINFDKRSARVVNFKGRDNLNKFLDSKLHFTMIPDASYQRFNKVIRWDAKIADFNEILGCDYVRIEQISQGGKKDLWYGFIDDISYQNDRTIFINWSVDIWQTFRDKIIFGNGTIARGFVKELDKDGHFTFEFKKVLNSPEHLPSDGGVMQVASENLTFLDNGKGDRINDDKLIFYVFTTQVGQVENGSFGSNTGLYQQNKYFFIPYNSRSGKTYEVWVNGEKLYTPNHPYIQDIMNDLAKDSDFVGTNSQVVDAEWQHFFGIDIEKVDIENMAIYLKWDTNKLDVDIKADGGNKFRVYKIRDLAGEGVGHQSATAFHQINKQLDIDENAPIVETIHKAIVAYLNIEESIYDFPYKLVTNEFSRLTLTNGRGVTKDYDVGTLEDADKEPLEVQRYGAVDTNNKEYYLVRKWRVDQTVPPFNSEQVLQRFEQSFLVDDAPRDVEIILDQATMYAQANKIQNATARQNAAMNRNLSNRQLDQSLQNQQNLMNTGMENMYSNRDYAQEKNLIGGIGGTLTGLATGGILGGISGALGGVANGIGTELNYQHQISNQNNLNATNLGNAEANNYLSKIGNQLNYENLVRTQQAGYAQSRVNTDQIAHQGTNSNFDFVNHNSSMLAKISLPAKALLTFSYMHMLQYGYAINILDDVNNYLTVKDKMNYIQAKHVQILGAVPQWVIQYFANVLDAGVQIWDYEAIDQYYANDVSNNHFLF